MLTTTDLRTSKTAKIKKLYYYITYIKAMLCHSYVPQSFGLGIVIPLLKGINLDKSNIDNYRAITLSPTIAKDFESYLLLIMQNFLHTSELQFGFKKGTGCMPRCYICALQYSS